MPNLRLFHLEGFLLLFCCLQVGELRAQPPGSWTQKASFGGGIRNGAVGFSIGSKGYVGTGNPGNSQPATNDFWEYDPTTNVWTQKANIGSSGRLGAIGFSIGNKGYLGTGHFQVSTNNYRGPLKTTISVFQVPSSSKTV